MQDCDRHSPVNLYFCDAKFSGTNFRYKTHE